MYEDRFCELNKQGLTLKCFYFPFAQNRCIVVSEIKRVYYEQQRFLSLHSKAWGMALSPVWWACDMGRKFRGQNGGIWNVTVDVGELTQKGFSVQDLQSFLDALRPLLNQEVDICEGLP